MERVNIDFVKLDKFDLLRICDESDLCGIRDLLSYIFKYEKENNTYVSDFYLNVDSLYYKKISKIYDFPVKRDVLLNAFIYAGYNHDLDVLFKLKPFVSKKHISVKELGSLFDYVMEHSMNFDEFCDGQEPKLIFDEVDNSFRDDFIYETNNKKYFK